MLKKRKIIFFIMIIIICVGVMIIKDKINSDSNEGVYVLSEEDNKMSINEENSNTKKEKEVENISTKEVTVYVSGAINNPGIVTLNQGDRLSDAVDKLGGMTEDADFNQVNLAIKVEDEKHYIIPKIGEKIEIPVEQRQESALENKENSTKININSATIEELDTLPGVGEATANKILNYRNENGKFNSIEEIKNVNGIGDKKYEEIKDLISVK